MGMMMKTKEGMESGLVLLGLHVRDLVYEPGKILRLNGQNIHMEINNLLRALLHSGKRQEFENGLEHLRNLVGGAHAKVTSTVSAGPTAAQDKQTADDSPEDDILELYTFIMLARQ